MAAFGAAHAVLIVPIWDRLAGGFPFALVAGVALAWSFYASAQGAASLGEGAWFGAQVWLALLPVTAFMFALRVTRLHDPARDTWEVVVGLLLAFAAGALLGWLRARRRSLALLMGITMVAVLMVMGGAVPVSKSRWAAGLYLSFLVIYPIAGALVALLARARFVKSLLNVRADVAAGGS